MGIDRSDIRLVIHNQLPGTVEAYYQECGRAGRDGDPARCLLLFSAADRELQEFFIEASYPSREVVLAVYQILLERTEDPIWLTHREIGTLLQPAAPEMAVSSCLRVLEEAGAVHRLNRYENRAELYLKLNLASILQSIPKRLTGKAQFLKTLGDSYTDEELREGVHFLPEEMIAKAGLAKETFRRIMADLEEKGEGAYIPPFRGRGLRILQRVRPEELKIDFPRLALRKAHEIEKLNRIMAYGTLNRCRRAFLLEYFGEYHREENCGGCDVCRNSGERPKGAEEKDPLLAVKILSGVARLEGRFGQGMAVKMLTGSREKTMEKFRLHRLSTYGLLADHTQEQVEKWLQELTALGLIKQEQTVLGEKRYPVILLTPRGKEAMRKRETVPLSPPPMPQKSAEEKTREEEFDKTLFEDLKKMRMQLARQEGLPPYSIFHDRTLREMATRRPASPREMLEVVGVGEVTFRKYGRFFLDLISSYGEDKGVRGEG
jgi:ATP-dependent DNA helicase RecQ